jgi:hypothetical protein
VRADLLAFFGVEEALKQRSEDRRIDLAPVETRRRLQKADVAGIERQRAAPVEEAAVEPGDFVDAEASPFLHRREEIVENLL